MTYKKIDVQIPSAFLGRVGIKSGCHQGSLSRYILLLNLVIISKHLGHH